VRPERREEFIAIFNSLWQGSTDIMAEVTNFVFYGWGRDPNEFVAMESWKSKDAVEAVRQSEGFKVAVARLLACCSKAMVMELYSPWEGPRDVFDAYPAGPSAVHPKAGEIGAVFV
jgi:quinol monooxygenase YgiN